MSEKIKKIINCGLKVNICNFRCHYCYVGQMEGYSTENPDLPYGVAMVRKALSYKRMGGPCLFNLCGAGETMLSPFIIDLTRNLLEEGHYVTVVTNGTITSRIDELCSLAEHEKDHLFVKFSFHYLELKRLNLLEEYFNNVRKIQKSGISMSIELTANDESIPYIPEIKEICVKEVGAWCHIIESRNDTTEELKRLTKLKAEEHLNAWESFDTKLISFQKTTWGVHRDEFCYAGDWLYNVDLWSGDVTICLKYGKKIGNIYENIEGDFHGVAIGTKCPWSHCFSSYFLLTNGVIPELCTPCYGELRDRVDNHGKHWLYDDVNAFFHSKLVESNSVYTEEKKKFINALMGVVYDSCKNEVEYKKLALSIDSYLMSKEVEHITVVLDENIDLLLFDFMMQILNQVTVRKKILLISRTDNLGETLVDQKTLYVIVNYPKFGMYAEQVLDNLRMIPITELLG